MSKAGYLTRYGTIYNHLSRNSYCSYERLIELLETRSETLQDRNHRARMGFSRRTIQRDLKEMESIFGIVVVFDRQRKGLVLRNNGHALLDNFHQLVESNALTEALVEGSRYAPYLKLSGKPSSGLESLPEYLTAISQRQQLRITYAPFEEAQLERTVAPYQIREYDGRWYLIALDLNPASNHIKCFALDRIQDYEVLKESFDAPDIAALDQLFKPCMGITKSEHQTIEVVLSFSKEEAPYIRSLPLHPSQEILRDTKQELIVRLRVYDTWELHAKIRSYGSHVKVVSPDSLREGILEDLKKTSKSYRQKA